MESELLRAGGEQVCEQVSKGSANGKDQALKPDGGVAAPAGYLLVAT